MTAYPKLRFWNVLVGALVAVEGVVMLVMSNDLSLPVTVGWLNDDPVEVQAAVPPHTFFSVRIGTAVATFLLLAAADHLLVAAPGVVRWYERGITAHRNILRWVEYSVSASIMISLIGLFVGIRDFGAVVAVFALNTTMILFGLLMERQQEPGRADWSAFWFGSLAGAVPWILVFAFVAGAPTVPGFVWAITLTQLILFMAFAINMALQYARVGRWRSYVFGEAGYIVLSVTAKSLLAWLIFANVLRT
jgi:hypothetical protein